MKRLISLVALLVLFALPGLGHPQVIKLPAKAEGQPGIPIQMIAEADGENVVWLTPDTRLVIIDGGFFKGESRRALLFGPKGVYKVWALTAKGNVISPKAECIVVIGDAVPPGPDPGPTPPDPGPGPTPGPSPIPGIGLRVLIVYESGTAKTPTQQAIMDGQAVRAYLRNKCAKGPDGKTPEWRILDKDASLTNLDKVWADAMKRHRASVPWIVIGSDKGGFEGALPDTMEKTMDLLMKYGG